jgi:anti-anti-sigma factor
MSFEHQFHGDVLVVRPIGRLDNASSPELERALREQLSRGVKHVLFDLADLDYISSAGLRAVLVAGKGVRAAQGRLVLAGPREAVRDVIDMSGFATLFAVCADAEEALRQF